MFNKHRFVVNPQHDSEGFTNYQAPCVGCGPTEPCWRSGHCERYNSPLRFVEPVVLTVDVAKMIEAHEAARESSALCISRDHNCGAPMCAEGCFVLGLHARDRNTLALADGRDMPYCVQCGVWHFPEVGHVEDISRRAVEARMVERAVHEEWRQRQLQARTDNAAEDARVEAVLPNPAGWNEPGMQPITWAESDVVRNGRAE